MRNWKEVPIPKRMQSLPLDKRGYPVPYIVATDKNGEPRFILNDERLVTEALHKELCTICGQHMGKQDRWMVGGPISAFHPHGSFIDAPTHYECLHYALQVCPYLAVSKYQRRASMRDFDADDFVSAADAMQVFHDPTQSEERVPFFAAVNVRRYQVRRPSPYERYLRPDRDYLAVEFWNDGVQISRAAAVELWAAHPSGEANKHLVIQLALTDY